MRLPGGLLQDGALHFERPLYSRLQKENRPVIPMLNPQRFRFGVTNLQIRNGPRDDEFPELPRNHLVEEHAVQLVLRMVELIPERLNLVGRCVRVVGDEQTQIQRMDRFFQPPDVTYRRFNGRRASFRSLPRGGTIVLGCPLSLR